MSVLIIENMPGTPLGLVGEALNEAAVALRRIAAYDGMAIPSSVGSHTGLIVLGGVQNALDDENHPYLPEVCHLIREFHQAERPVLGICLGSQLIARAFGADNILGRPVEFGWCDVTPTDEALTDPVLGHLGAGAALFHWHTDTFSLPEGAVRLASSVMTQNQAFRIGQTTYGVQFHFEAGKQVVGEWVTNFADDIASHSPDWPDRYPAELARHGTAADSTGLDLARAWVRLLKTG